MADKIDQAQPLAAALLELAFRRVGRILRDRKSSDASVLRAARFVAEYAVGKPVTMVRMLGAGDIEDLPEDLLRQIWRGDLDPFAAGLCKALPAPAPGAVTIDGTAVDVSRVAGVRSVPDDDEGPPL